MEKEKCYICGRDDVILSNVECKYGYIRKVCRWCEKEKIDFVDYYKKLELKIDAIINSLAESQRCEVESKSRYYVEKEAFKDVE